MKKPLIKLNLIASLMLVFFSACCQIPARPAGEQPSFCEQYADTRLSRAFSADAGERGDESGLLLMRDGNKALVERLYLADMAEKGIDAQYYIWNGDKTGKLIIQRLLLAAERGVSVRLLLDDFNVGSRNNMLIAVNSHPNIQIRIYNPFMMRSAMGKWVNFAFDFDRLNRRMHNKTFVVDGAVAITGGRNIGDEYFNRNDRINFCDLDLLSTGPVVKQVSKSFCYYWDSPFVVPIDRLFESDSKKTAEEQNNDILNADLAEQLQIELPTDLSMLESYFKNLAGDMVWAPATFLADNPVGWSNGACSGEPKRVARHLLQLAENSRKEILIESAYFVLNDVALEVIADARKSGARVRALTNSMASNDVLPNHASYAMVRQDMLKHGIELYELRPDARSCLELIGSKEYCDADSLFGLHAKSAVFDRHTVYVGSMNLNLRSAYLNTEAAMIIQSPVLADRLTRQIEMNMGQENSWRVTRGDDNRLVWLTNRNGREETSRHEPQTSWLNRVKAVLLTLLPGSLYY